MAASLQIWRFTEGNRAHEKQTKALIEGLSLKVEVVVSEIDCQKWRLFGSLPDLSSLPKPDLLLGAGHATHWAMVRCKWRFGGHVAVIMKPSLPLCLFDSAIIPRHDQPANREKIFASQGMLNPAFESQADMNKGVILLGGINKYFTWNEASIVQQINAITQANPQCQWQVSNSRRTPASFSYQAILADNVQWVDWQHEGPEWLPQQLSSAGVIWVSCDSMSMIYEALNSKAQVGILELPLLKKANKMSFELKRLVEQKLLMNHANRESSLQMRLPLNEHYRAAEWLLKRLSSR